MKRLTTLGLVLCTLLLVLSSAPPASAQAPKRTLTISTWGGITEDAIKKYVQPQFEAKYNAKLDYDIGGQGIRFNKLLAQKGNSQIDVFFSTDEAVFAGITEDLFVKVNKSNIPRFNDVYDWANPTGDYGVAYAIITYGLAYHTGLVSNPPTSWIDMWRPEFKGKLALAAVAHSQSLSILIRAAELNGGSRENITRGLIQMAALRPIRLTTFWTDWAPMVKSGEVTLATEFDYYIQAMIDQGYPVAWVLPSDGGIASLQHLSIVKGTKVQDLAEAFINELLSPEIQIKFAQDTYYGPSNKTVVLDPALAQRVTYGANLTGVRFFDGKWNAEQRPFLVERYNTEVMPFWK